MSTVSDGQRTCRSALFAPPGRAALSEATAAAYTRRSETIAREHTP